MPALHHVWVTSRQAGLVRADRIVGLGVKGRYGEFERPVAAEQEVDIAAEVLGAGEGGTTILLSLLSCPPARAAGVLAGLARSLAEAAGRSEPCLFIYPGPAGPERPAWATDPDLPPWWNEPRHPFSA